MKITETTEPSEIKHKVYACEAPGCTFTVIDSEWAFNQHYAKEHACLEERRIGDFCLLRFATEGDAKAYAEASEDRGSRVTWTGPGWYVGDYVSGRCPRGGGTETFYRLRPISEVRYELREELRDLAGRLKGLIAVEKETP